MAITFVLNGYFRSGTTMLWRVMQLSNTNKYVFCEPLHNELFRMVHNEQYGNIYGHNMSTTTEYTELSYDVLKKLKELHPNLGESVFTYNIRGVVEYLKIFESLERDVILQPNRMHFMLSDIHNYFGCKVAHIIRHPLDVFRSVMFSSPILKNLSKAIGVCPYFLRALKKEDPYYLISAYKFMWQYFGNESETSGLWHRLTKPRDYFMSRFILAWTLANWHAVKEIERVDGLVVTYEDIVTRPETLDLMERYSGTKFHNYDKVLRKDSIGRYRPREVDILMSIATKMGVGDKLSELLKRFKYMS